MRRNRVLGKGISKPGVDLTSRPDQTYFSRRRNRRKKQDWEQQAMDDRHDYLANPKNEEFIRRIESC